MRGMEVARGFVHKLYSLDLFIYLIHYIYASHPSHGTLKRPLYAWKLMAQMEGAQASMAKAILGWLRPGWKHVLGI